MTCSRDSCLYCQHYNAFSKFKLFRFMSWSQNKRNFVSKFLCSWHAVQNITLPILRALQCHPRVSLLDLQFYDCQIAALSQRVLRDLKGNTKLKSALLELSADNLQEEDGDLHPLNVALRRAILQAPCLETLTLRFSPEFSSPVDDTGLFTPLPRVQWLPADRDILHSLRHLKLDGPSIEIRQGLIGALPHANLVVLDLWHCGNCQYFFDTISTQSTELKLRSFKIAEKPGGWLSSSYGIGAVQSFLVSFQGLEELALEGYGGRQLAFVTWHHRTLQDLTLIDDCTKRWKMTAAAQQEKAQGLKAIRDDCINLQSLRINEFYAFLHTVSTAHEGVAKVVSNFMAQTPRQISNDLTLLSETRKKLSALIFH